MFDNVKRQRHYEFGNVYLARKSKKGKHINLQFIVRNHEGHEVIVSAPIMIGGKDKNIYAEIVDDGQGAIIHVRNLTEYVPTATEAVPDDGDECPF